MACDLTRFQLAAIIGSIGKDVIAHGDYAFQCFDTRNLEEQLPRVLKDLERQRQESLSRKRTGRGWFTALVVQMKSE